MYINLNAFNFEKNKKVIIKQIRSSSGRAKNQKGTLLCLGLGKIGWKTERVVNREIIGMINTVIHLIEYEFVSE